VHLIAVVVLAGCGSLPLDQPNPPPDWPDPPSAEAPPSEPADTDAPAAPAEAPPVEPAPPVGTPEATPP
jgi:hypothetical protein